MCGKLSVLMYVAIVKQVYQTVVSISIWTPNDDVVLTSGIQAFPSQHVTSSCTMTASALEVLVVQKCVVG